MNKISRLDGERKRVVTSERKTILGGDTVQCSPDQIRKRIYDLRRQEAIIEEKEFELRKIVQRREKIEVGTS